MSEKSAAGYLKVAPLSRGAFGSFNAVAAQTEADASRLLRLGAHSPVVAGNLKFDAVAFQRSDDFEQSFRKRYGRRPVFLAASTRDGEEAILLDALARVPMREILVVIVPRHPQRFETVAELMKTRGVKFERRSGNSNVPIECNFVLGDSVGEMGAYYRSSDVAFVGGSLLDYGGQNLIEACSAGVPVLIGPFTRNFQEAADLAIKAGAARRTMNAAETIEVAFELIADPNTRLEMGRAGKIFCAQHQGATDKTVDIVLRLLNTNLQSGRH
jgi:3-deoxy-D-manno-octulosonic-acid transferase